MEKIKRSFLYNNSLSIVFVILALLSLVGQYFTGWHEYNEFLHDHGQPSVALLQYISSGHFQQATFENWESEFFQMALFVIPYHFPAPERLVRIEANGGKGGG
jgi:hypothetical protein